MKIRYSKKALKFLSRLDEKSVDRIRKGIGGLTAVPPEGDIKPLKGYDDGRMRLRVGDWHIIYRHDTEGAIEVLCIIEIGNRGDVYT